MTVDDEAGSDTRRRRNQAERTAATRAALLAAARKLFADRGFAESSAQAVGSAATGPVAAMRVESPFLDDGIAGGDG